MCAVYSPTTNAQWVHSSFGLVLPQAALDIYPGQVGPIVVRSRRDGRLAIGLAQFGLIPPWAKDDKGARHTYNARSETAAQKPSFRDAWRDCQWAIVLADRFFEPCYETGKAVRWGMALADGNPMGIAGLWQRWREPLSEQLKVSFTMLTVNAHGHPIMSRMHKPGDEKRTPAVLSAGSFNEWLRSTSDNAHDLLKQESMPPLVAQPMV
jgi:putative SOS response-associated peptidase YedK